MKPQRKPLKPQPAKPSPDSAITGADPLRLEAERGWAESDRRRAQRVKRVRSRGRVRAESSELKHQLRLTKKAGAPQPRKP